MVEPNPDLRISITDVAAHRALQLAETRLRPSGFRLRNVPSTFIRSVPLCEGLVDLQGQAAPAKRRMLMGSSSLKSFNLPIVGLGGSGAMLSRSGAIPGLGPSDE
jgi:hypothetical protein